MANIDKNRGKVLILEDEPITGQLIARILAMEGYETEIAINGLIAKDKIEANQDYDFCVFDIKTPIMNGIQVYEYIEQECPGLAQRVIFTTGDCLGLVTKDFLERVRRPFLSKPYTPSQLTTLVREAFSLSTAVS